MSGLLRNLLTLLAALWQRNTAAAQGTTVVRFLVTPLDTGIATLKSDRYFQLAESAQFDFLVKTSLLVPLLRGGCSFVNVAQMARFVRPVRLFDRVSAHTRVAWADERHAFFEHTFSVRGAVHAQVLVKMKFKQGRLTVPPARFVGEFGAQQPQVLRLWDESLAQAAGPGL